MLTSGVKAMVGPTVLLFILVHARREALYFAKTCERAECMRERGVRYRSSYSPSEGNSSYMFLLAWWTPWAYGGEGVRHTSGSTVDCVKSVRLVALDSGRSLSLGTGSDVEVVMLCSWYATMRYKTRPESCRGGGETQRDG